MSPKKEIMKITNLKCNIKKSLRSVNRNGIFKPKSVSY